MIRQHSRRGELQHRAVIVEKRCFLAGAAMGRIDKGLRWRHRAVAANPAGARRGLRLTELLVSIAARSRRKVRTSEASARRRRNAPDRPKGLAPDFVQTLTQTFALFL